MKRVEKVEFFRCFCSHCGTSTCTPGGVRDLKALGWYIGKDDMFCPNCQSRFRRLPVVVGMPVFSMILDKDRGIFPGFRYYVTEAVRNDPNAVYVDVGNGWQARLNLGEWDLDEPTAVRVQNLNGCF